MIFQNLSSRFLNIGLSTVSVKITASGKLFHVFLIRRLCECRVNKSECRRVIKVLLECMCLLLLLSKFTQVVDFSDLLNSTF